MVQRPVRQAAKRASLFIQQQQSSTPYLTQAIPTTPADANHHIPIEHHHRIIVDDDLDKRNDLVKSDSMHYCPSIIDAYPTVVVAENPYHIVTDEHVSYRGASYIYETSNYSSPYYTVSILIN